MRKTPSEENQSTRDDPVTVYVAFGMSEAQVVKTKLEEAGLPVLLQYESLGPVIGIGLAEVRVQVPGVLAETAREIIEGGTWELH